MEIAKEVINFWSSYSIGVRWTFFILFAFILISWLFIIPFIQSKESTTQIETTPKKIEELKQKPSVHLSNSIEELRSLEEVRELTNSENELNLYQLPNGVYGWVESHKLDTPNLWIPDAPFAEDSFAIPSSIQLRKEKKWGNDIEVHKDKDGVVRVQAFITDNTRLQLQKPNRAEVLSLTVVFRAYSEYKFIASLPRESVESFKHREFSDSETAADIRVSKIV